MNVVLAGGCFWGLQAALDLCVGIGNTQTGFANGKDCQTVSYKEVYTDTTGFAEAVSFDLQGTSLDKVLDYFFFFTDPTSLNQQGHDVGTRYRSILLYQDDYQKEIMKEAINRLSPKPVVTTVEKLRNFIKAEDYHQKYLENNIGGYCHLDLNACKGYLKSNNLLKNLYL